MNTNFKSLMKKQWSFKNEIYYIDIIVISCMIGAMLKIVSGNMIIISDSSVMMFIIMLVYGIKSSIFNIFIFIGVKLAITSIMSWVVWVSDISNGNYKTLWSERIHQYINDTDVRG